MTEAPAMFEKILLIEDEEPHELFITRALKKLGARVESATTVGAGLEALGQKEYELVISDLNLPDSTPSLSIKRVIEAAGATPVIVLTSSRRLTDAVEAMRFGAEDYLVKDFDGSFNEVLSISMAKVFSKVELEREKARLQREMAILRVAIENSADAMAIANREGNIEYANHTYRDFVRRCGGEDAQNVRVMFTDVVEKAEALKENVLSQLESLEAGAHWSTELVFAAEKGTAFDLAVSVIPAGANDREHPCVIWIKDISGLKQRENFQRKILSTTSHDLKGPLGSIALSSELIQDMTEQEGKPHQLAMRIESAARGAINLIDEFLSARRIQEGTFILTPERQKIAPLLETIKEDYGALAAPKKISLSLEVSPNTEGSVDGIGFIRAVGNLLTNALKFTHKEGAVSMRAEQRHGDLIVTVKDNGSGMEPAEVQRVFERFGRLEKHRAIEGSGLGLFVVKSIVTAHGGQIEVTSKPEQGTQFTLTFPEVPPVNDRGELISLDFE